MRRRLADQGRRSVSSAQALTPKHAAAYPAVEMAATTISVEVEAHVKNMPSKDAARQHRSNSVSIIGAVSTKPMISSAVQRLSIFLLCVATSIV